MNSKTVPLCNKMITIIKDMILERYVHTLQIKRQSVNSISHLTLSELICVRNKYIQNKHEDKKSEALTKKRQAV